MLNAGDHKDQKRVLDSLMLELQAVVSCRTWVLGTKGRSSAVAVSTLSR